MCQERRIERADPREDERVRQEFSVGRSVGRVWRENERVGRETLFRSNDHDQWGEYSALRARFFYKSSINSESRFKR